MHNEIYLLTTCRPLIAHRKANMFFFMTSLHGKNTSHDGWIVLSVIEYFSVKETDKPNRKLQNSPLKRNGFFVFKEKHIFFQKLFFLRTSVQLTYLSLKRTKFGPVNSLWHFRLNRFLKFARMPRTFRSNINGEHRLLFLIIRLSFVSLVGHENWN